jgi:hypothetical protein
VPRDALCTTMPLAFMAQESGIENNSWSH